MIRAAYDERERVQLIFPEEEVSRTKQSFKDEVDINNILRKYQKTGAIEHLRRHGGDYTFAEALEFKQCMDIVAKGNSMFEELPSSLRKRFGSPEGFLEFVQDPENTDEAIELGLATRRAAPEAPREPIPSMAEHIEGERHDAAEDA